MVTYGLYTSRGHPLAAHHARLYSSIRALTFKDVCTEAVEDEDEVLLDNHILLLFRHNFASTLHWRLSLSFALFLLRRDGLIQVNGQIGVTLMNSAFFRRSPCVFFADPGAAITVVKQDGTDARRQSAAPASLYCLSL